MKKSMSRMFSIIALAVFAALFSGLNIKSYSQEDSGIKYRFADYAVPGDLMYFETASLNNLASGITEFYTALRGENAAGELNMLTTQMTMATGINPLDAESMKSAGIDTTSPAAFILKDINTGILSQQSGMSRDGFNPAEKKQPDGSAAASGIEWAVFISASDSTLLYGTMTKLFMRKNVPDQEPVFIELQKNKLSSFKTGGFFIARADKYIVFAGSKETALAMMNKAKSPLTESPGFKKMRGHLSPKMKSRDAVAFYYFNYNKYLDLSFESYKTFGDKLQAAIKPMLEEIKANTVSVGGIAYIGGAGLRFDSTSIYKDGYLSDQTKNIPRLLQFEKRNVASDYVKKTPAFYGTVKFNMQELIKLVLSLDPSIRINYENLVEQAKKESNIDLSKDFIELLTGNISMQVPALPAIGQIKISDLTFSVSCAYKPGSEAAISGILQKLSVEMERAKNPVITKSEFLGGVLWEIKNTKRDYSQLVDDEGNSPQKTDIYYVYLGTDQMIFALDKKHISEILISKNMKTVGASEFGLTREKENMTNMLMYLNFDSVSRLLENPAMNMKPYIQYIANIDSMNIISYMERDNATSEFELRLKRKN